MVISTQLVGKKSLSVSFVEVNRSLSQQLKATSIPLCHISEDVGGLLWSFHISYYICDQAGSIKLRSLQRLLLGCHVLYAIHIPLVKQDKGPSILSADTLPWKRRWHRQGTWQPVRLWENSID